METARPDVLDPAAQPRRVVELLADGRVLLVVHALAGDCLRYRELERRVDGMPQRALTQTLQTLMRYGLAERTQDGDGYRLTALGESLRAEVVDPLCAWAVDHAEDVRARRESSARRPARSGGGGCAPPAS